MPIYEYTCRACDHLFEALVRGGAAAVCPSCESTDLERMLSLPRVRSEATRGKAMKAARKRDQKQGADRTRERVEYEASHD